MHMINAQRGEVALKHQDISYTMVLSLNALAQIEAGLGINNLSDLFTKLAQANFSQADIMLILSAALIAGGMTNEKAEKLVGELSLIEAMQSVANLMEASFAPLLGAEKKVETAS